MVSADSRGAGGNIATGYCLPSEAEPCRPAEEPPAPRRTFRGWRDLGAGDYGRIGKLGGRRPPPVSSTRYYALKPSPFPFALVEVPVVPRKINCVFPDMPPHGVPGVYRLYRGEQIVYIGQSGNVRDRMCVHSRRFHVDRFTYEVVPDRRERMALERRLINEHRPVENGVIPVVREWL